MRRFLALFTATLLLMSMTLTGCDTEGNSKDSSGFSSETSEELENNISHSQDAPDDMVINVFSSSDELPRMVERYKELHPDFTYEIKAFTFATMDLVFYKVLDLYLDAGDVDIPDIYCLQSNYVMRYSKGDMAAFATPYKDLLTDYDKLLIKADIPQYILDMGSDPEGNIVALAYRGTGGAFIYRRSIAKDVWGTDEPEVIKDKIGPGWDKFFLAAAEIKDKGYGIVSGEGDLWQSVDNSADLPWVVNGRLYIDPKREVFLDYAKELADKGYSNNTTVWRDDWYLDIKGAGDKQILGFFGPSWLISYVLMNNCGGSKGGEGTYGDWAVCEPPVGFFQGGEWIFVNKSSKHKEAISDIIRWITLDSSENGLQYQLANGTYKDLDGIFEAVASGTVMRKSSARLDFLGNQNMHEVFDRAARLANGRNITGYDEAISTYWLEQVREYATSNKSKEEAIADFKERVKAKLNIVTE